MQLLLPSPKRFLTNKISSFLVSELKYEFGADNFCLKEVYATEDFPTLQIPLHLLDPHCHFDCR